MAEETRNDGLHPRHPGRGCATTIVLAESVTGEPEVGGLVIFFPSGRHIALGWRQAMPIQPTLEACKHFTAKIVEQLLKVDSDEARSDLKATNWASAAAAIQRCILDWNDGIQQRINDRWAQVFKDQRLH